MYLSSPTIAPYGFAGLGMTLSDLAAAITRMEGSCSAPGVCVNNNPGNLRAYAPGQPVDSRGIRIFPTYQAGYDALLSQEQMNISRGLTLDEFFGGKTGVYSGYAPAADKNQPTVYAGNVSTWLGIPRDVPLAQFLGGSNVSGEVGTGLPPVAGDETYFPDASGWSVDGAGEGLSPLAWSAIAAVTLAGLYAVV